MPHGFLILNYSVVLHSLNCFHFTDHVQTLLSKLIIHLIPLPYFDSLAFYFFLKVSEVLFPVKAFGYTSRYLVIRRFVTGHL
jgi:hypothetical protein